MFLDPQKYPRWAGPLVATTVGFTVALHSGLDPLKLSIGMGCGFAAGCLLLLFAEWLQSVDSFDRQPSLLGIVFAVLAIPSGLMPVLGFAICVPAFLLNRRVAGWANSTSRSALTLCVVTSAALGAAFFFVR
jgi:hypothetical protein